MSRHVIGEPCPINPGEPIIESFTDHAREGPFNACADCHDDQRTIRERLTDLEDELTDRANMPGRGN